jgi:hypothetical protein
MALPNSKGAPSFAGGRAKPWWGRLRGTQWRELGDRLSEARTKADGGFRLSLPSFFSSRIAGGLLRGSVALCGAALYEAAR